VEQLSAQHLHLHLHKTTHTASSRLPYSYKSNIIIVMSKASFDPTTDIPDQSGRVFFITGGARPSNASYLSNLLTSSFRHHRTRRLLDIIHCRSKPSPHLLQRPEPETRRRPHYQSATSLALHQTNIYRMRPRKPRFSTSSI
jgi:hypothetical protein